MLCKARGHKHLLEKKKQGKAALFYRRKLPEYFQNQKFHSHPSGPHSQFTLPLMLFTLNIRHLKGEKKKRDKYYLPRNVCFVIVCPLVLCILVK